MKLSQLRTQALINKSAEFLQRVAASGKQKEKRLWAIAAEVLTGRRNWSPEIVLVKASCRATALAQYFLGQNRRARIVACAPALGFWLDDEKDETKLSA